MLDSGVSAMQESVGGGRDHRLSFVLSRGVVVVGSFEQGSFERGWWCVDRRNTPPSRNLSEGGVGGGVSTEETPLRLVFQVREGWRVC